MIETVSIGNKTPRTPLEQLAHDKLVDLFTGYAQELLPDLDRPFVYQVWHGDPELVSHGADRPGHRRVDLTYDSIVENMLTYQLGLLFYPLELATRPANLFHFMVSAADLPSNVHQQERVDWNSRPDAVCTWGRGKWYQVMVQPREGVDWGTFKDSLRGTLRGTVVKTNAEGDGLMALPKLTTRGRSTWWSYAEQLALAEWQAGCPAGQHLKSV